LDASHQPASPFPGLHPHILPLSFSSKPTAPTELYTLSLHDALPIWFMQLADTTGYHIEMIVTGIDLDAPALPVFFIVERMAHVVDRKSTRLNSSHVKISYAVFCLKKKKKKGSTNKNIDTREAIPSPH